MHIWVVSDHGHSPVGNHEDLVGLLRGLGLRAIAHPWVYSMSAEVAVMVSGNAMAHVYLDLAKRERPWWPSHNPRWKEIAELLMSRPSVDLMILPSSPNECEVHGNGRGRARMMWQDGVISYEPVTGDPLGIGEQRELGRRRGL